MTFKIFCGWALMFAGVAIICSTIYFSYNIFTAKFEVPEIFSMDAVEQGKDSLPMPDLSKGTEGMSPEVQQEIMRQMIGEQVKEILPTEFLLIFLNLIAWSIFAGIAIFGGGQLSGLGIRLIKAV